MKHGANHQDLYYGKLRRHMLNRQLRARDITDPLVLKAMAKVPREKFVPEDLAPMAYLDRPLPIGHHQTISQPYVVALMAQLLELTPLCRVLEVGTGSGYNAAVLSQIAHEVYTIEIIPDLFKAAEKCFWQMGFDNVHTKLGDGNMGWKEQGPFDAIVYTAATEEVPTEIFTQLKRGGNLIAPIDDGHQQILTRYIRDPQSGLISEESITEVKFVPLRHQAPPQHKAQSQAW